MNKLSFPNIANSPPPPDQMVGPLLSCLLQLSDMLYPLHQIPWSCVCRALVLQLVLALVILRWKPGYDALNWLGQQVTQFLNYTNAGSRFVFGDSFMNHRIVMQVLNEFGNENHLFNNQ